MDKLGNTTACCLLQYLDNFDLENETEMFSRLIISICITLKVSLYPNMVTFVSSLIVVNLQGNCQKDVTLMCQADE